MFVSPYHILCATKQSFYAKQCINLMSQTNSKLLTQVLSDDSNDNDNTVNNNSDSLTQVLSDDSNDNDNTIINNSDSLTQVLSDDSNDNNNSNEPPLKKQKININSDIQVLRHAITSSFIQFKNQIDKTLDLMDNTSKLMCSAKKKYVTEYDRANTNQEKNKLLQQQIKSNHQNFLQWYEK